MNDGEFTVRTWLGYQVDYRWMIKRLEAHAMLGWAKLIVGAGGATLFVITMLAWTSPGMVRDGVGTAAWGFGAILAALWALRWWFLPWPSRSESLVWITLADISLAMGVLTVHNHLYGVIATLLLVVPGGYACMLGPRVLARHGAWSLATMVVVTLQLVTEDSPRTGDAPADYVIGVLIVLIMLTATATAFLTMAFQSWMWHLDALMDPLTMLLNRRGLDYYLWKYLGSCARPDSIYAITLDLDRFKIVNDAFGHPVGDKVLQQTARCLRSTADLDAIVARTGGEEFVIVGATRGDSMCAVAERLRSAIETMPGLPIPITASVGVVSAKTSLAFEPATFRQLLLCSDSAMYQAKRLGGNTVAIAEAMPTHPAR
ncbi:diguanylate cyclase [Nocardia sp. NPDC049149]|uniref:GGDEF domain-containing protein n=1 Tax=Nocardia sp. NPDC049149 TaxID=3364315 RepID=UPI0037116589